ncbi:hypothetical protein GV828_05650 [Flavobacterium sp. NST-5]|uniref:Lipoprotein n=1 Tax=Flavobacterium ichthyis TaxID=2698827 RepID=A0ABW9Z738_9FLAO|nr:hypothetical protein [Flavobacterium ichthyis]NBL64682.1 hypothetical protein [Flavobacterium ichthyis]
MKQIFIATSLMIMLMGCHSQKKSMEENKVTISNCPNTGTCKFEVFENKKLVLNTDVTDKIYYAFEDNVGSNVYVYQYNKITEPELVDAGYREEVLFELDQNMAKINLEDKNLQEIKLVFGVMCFCRGKAGNYQVLSGKFSYDSQNVSIELPDIVPDQILHNINIDLK